MSKDKIVKLDREKIYRIGKEGRWCEFKRYDDNGNVLSIRYIDEPILIEKRYPAMIFIFPNIGDRIKLDFKDNESRDKAFNDITNKLSDKNEIKLKEAIRTNNRWYKNCKSLRKKDGKICKVCPFRKEIENEEEKC